MALCRRGSSTLYVQQGPTVEPVQMNTKPLSRKEDSKPKVQQFLVQTSPWAQLNLGRLRELRLQRPVQSRLFYSSVARLPEAQLNGRC